MSYTTKIQLSNKHKVELITTFLCAFIIGLSLGLSFSLPIQVTGPVYSVLGANSMSSPISVAVRDPATGNVRPSIRVKSGEPILVQIEMDSVHYIPGSQLEIRLATGIIPVHKDTEDILWQENGSQRNWVGIIDVAQESDRLYSFSVQLQNNTPQFNTITVLLTAPSDPVKASEKVIIERSTE